ncbi:MULTISPECIES: hypothetical protein [unclassified Kitasatospora]|uniref:hypothetical protein n=1 Tax=unclassified Kitasatospora TaxID=2633591 RepID=UPI0033D171D7
MDPVTGRRSTVPGARSPACRAEVSGGRHAAPGGAGAQLFDGMEVPEELASRFKFARQKSKLAGTIRGSYFVIKNEY